MTKSEKAVETFQRTNCAQAVLTAFAGDYGIDEKTALRFAMAFGAGMGRMGNTCGAVTGAFMVLGLKYGSLDIPPAKKKELTYKKVNEFAAKFKERNNTLLCKELLGIDLLTEEGQKIFNEKKLHLNQCSKYVSDAAEILEEIK